MKRVFLLFATIIMASGAMYGQQTNRQNGDRLFDEGKYEDAKGQYQLYKAVDPNAQVSYADERIAQCNKCAQLMGAANYLWAKGQQAEALEAYREILAINPKDPVARARVGNATTAPPTTTVTRHPAEPDMVYVQGGTFWMGSADGESDEAPVHQVTVGNFYIGKYEVTQAQWRTIMGTTVSQQHDKVGEGLDLYGVGDTYPMYYVSWEEVQEFISRLNAATGKHYRLPTEAEWEYAARGGSKSQGYTYSGSNSIGNVSWYGDNSGSTTHPVGTKSPNELGIFDMSGNVWEWCGDWYGTYSSSAQTNPTGSSSGSFRVLRGGSWYNGAQFCRSANRISNTPGYRYNHLGFRVVLVP